MEKKTTISIQVVIKAPVKKVWKFYTEPEHIKQWNQASGDWHTPKVENNLKPRGKFTFRMEARDGSFGFDFSGTYDEVKINQLIAYTMDDNRKVKVTFTDTITETKVTILFDAEKTNSIEMQREGWQTILNNFKKYTESTK
jgi:uncharacterized protein YndB with AHSA1/START domain